MRRNVSAFINNIQFSETLDEFRSDYIDCGRLFSGSTLLDDVTDGRTGWTVPRWAVTGDVCLFFCAVSVLAKIRHLRSLMKQDSALMDRILMQGLDEAEEFYRTYGGKIYVVGRVSGKPWYEDDDSGLNHWKSRIYADVDDLVLLDRPVGIGDFRDFIRLSRQSAITPVFGDRFERLKALIAARNDMPDWFLGSKSTPFPVGAVDRNNWLAVGKIHRHAFFLEQQFRDFWVDYFLERLGDQKTFYAECAAYGSGRYVGSVDNCIWLGGKLLCVEVKLDVGTEAHLEDQLSKYLNADEIAAGSRRISGNKLEKRHVAVVDRNGVYLYDGAGLRMIAELDNIDDVDDIVTVRGRMLS